MNRIRRAPERRRRGVKGFCKEPAPARNDLKKALSSRITGRKRLLSWCHPCSAAAEPPFCSGYGERAVYVSIPAAEAVFPPVLAVNAFSHGVFLCPAVSGLLMPRRRGAIDGISFSEKSQENGALSRMLRRAAAGGAGSMRSGYAVKGFVLGLMISRQSKSPRSRPWMSISAVATLVAKGMLYWSHRRVI